MATDPEVTEDGISKVTMLDVSTILKTAQGPKETIIYDYVLQCKSFVRMQLSI